MPTHTLTPPGGLQLGHIDGVWEPFFAGGPDPKNGTEEIITSNVSRAWPVPDAGVGALTYLLEILTGAMGSRRRWRTMPWLVLLFGLMIVPLGVVSVFFALIALSMPRGRVRERYAGWTPRIV